MPSILRIFGLGNNNLTTGPPVRQIMINNQIMIYSEKKHLDSSELISNEINSCEEICKRICKQLNITPKLYLLFSIRIAKSKFYLPSCQNLQTNIKYEFRLRYQMYDLSTMLRFDKNAYKYLYLQVMHDLINDHIPELTYSEKTSRKDKDTMFGLCFTSMLIDIMESRISKNDLTLMANKYLPVRFVKNHTATVIRYMISQQIKKFEVMCMSNRDSYKCRSAYLNIIRSLAPSYFEEHYKGSTNYNNKDEEVDIFFSPFHKERPGLLYLQRQDEKHLSTIDDIYGIRFEGEKVFFEMRNSPPTKEKFFLRFETTEQLESFVSCLSGYYRLMVKWTFDLCDAFKSPLLENLNMERCHGPISGMHSYEILKNHYNNCGLFLIRQCDREYDKYFIDIITTEARIPDTFHINFKNQKWYLDHNFEKSFKNLTELAESITTEAERKQRISPSNNDKNLLLCAKPENYVIKTEISEDIESEMRQKPSRIIDLVKEIQIYEPATFDYGNIREMRADWLLPKDKKLKVTLKQLKIKEKKDVNDITQLVQQWSFLQATELIKMYGFYLTSPYTIVFESYEFGPLDTFLQNEKDINCKFLTEAAYTLARALHYLEEKEIIHGKIRCNNLKVVKFKKGSELIVRLGDYICQSIRSGQEDDPWLAIECRKNKNHAFNFKTELWSYATTLWEIFSNGEKPKEKDNLRKPAKCSEKMYQLMCNGWQHEPNKRMSAQMIISFLVSSETTLKHIYEINSSSGSSKNVNDVIYPPRKDKIGTVYFLKDDGKLIITYSEKTLLGKGHFGEVFEGLYIKDNHSLEVAVKKIKERYDQARKEIEIAMNVRHDNIVKTITWSDEPFLIIMELLTSFLHHLRIKKGQIQTKQLLEYAKDIANGMQYLVSKKYVHRDLAARNILMNKNGTLKISDFGLATKTEIDKDYYATRDPNREFPFIWHAPECLRGNKKYSHQSDVWSYGVTLFEIFSFGEYPYLKRDGYAVKCRDEHCELLEQNYRLLNPKNCDDDIYEKLMKPCWHKNAKDRPLFIDILKELDKFIELA